MSEEGRCSSETEQTLFVRTECSVCQEASHQQTEVEHNNPIFASLDNPSGGCTDSNSRFLHDLGSMGSGDRWNLLTHSKCIGITDSSVTPVEWTGLRTK